MKIIDDYVFSETLDIINHLEHSLYEKIPRGLINFLQENSSEEYQSNIDFGKSINLQEISPYTRAILAIVYRDYICDKTKKKQLLDEDRKYFAEKYAREFENLNNHKNNTI